MAEWYVVHMSNPQEFDIRKNTYNEEGCCGNLSKRKVREIDFRYKKWDDILEQAK